MKYEAPNEMGHEAVEELARANDSAALAEAVIGLSLADPDVGSG